MNTSAQGPNTVDARGDALRGSGATETNSTPTDDIFLGSVEEHDKAMIHDLDQRDKDMNTVLISAGAITLTQMRWVVLNIRSLYVNSARQAGYYQWLDAAVCSHMSRRAAAAASHAVAAQGSVPSFSLPPHPAPDLPFSDFIRVNMYWSAGLVFSLLAMCLAMLGKQVVRSHRQMLDLVRQDPVLKSLRIWDLQDEHSQRWFMEKVIDGMYRSFQVALVVCFLGHIDAVLTPIGVVGLVPVVVWGTLYVLGDRGTNTFP